MDFIINNLATIIVGIIIVGVLTGIIIKLVSDKRKGKSACGCNCGCCPNSKLCHPTNAD